MKIKLYDCFQHWYHGGVIRIISDTHFNDADCKTMDDKWPSPEEQVKTINRFVGKKDTLIILGDVGDESYVQNLKGYKVLIMGNHDKGETIYKEYFDEVYSGPLFISDKILLSHEPIFIPFGVNIHGHDHSGAFSTNGGDRASYNLASNVCGYMPWRLDELMSYIKPISLHRLTIDYQTTHSIKAKNNNSKVEFINEI